jgi:putative component of membrane protein insertase Oxa1/YidC/SpoIIIJ protein YidD
VDSLKRIQRKNYATRLRRYLKMKKIVNIVIICTFLCPAASQIVLGDEQTIRPETSDADTSPVAVALTFYRKTVSRADGRRCMMYPSCSHYSEQAFEKHGFIKGWVMTSDRLLRCGRDEQRISEQIIIDRQAYVFDPVQRNDFWWSRP